MLIVMSAVAVSVRLFQKSTDNRLHGLRQVLGWNLSRNIRLYIDDILLKIFKFVFWLRLSFFATTGEILVRLRNTLSQCCCTPQFNFRFASKPLCSAFVLEKMPSHIRCWTHAGTHTHT